MWAFAGLLSALFLGIYDIFKKTSLNGNAVLPVLLGEVNLKQKGIYLMGILVGTLLMTLGSS